MFIGRRVAVFELSKKIHIGKRDSDNWIIISISEEGLFMAYELFKVTGVEFQHLFIDPVPTPNNSECKVAMISELNDIVINEDLKSVFNIDSEYILSSAETIFKESIRPKLQTYRDGEQLDIVDKSRKVIILDDGIETGLRVMTAIKTIRNMGFKHINVATPIIPDTIFDDIKSEVDEVYFIDRVIHYTKTSDYYQQSNRFTKQVLDDIWSCMRSFKNGNIDKLELF